MAFRFPLSFAALNLPLLTVASVGGAKAQTPEAALAGFEDRFDRLLRADAGNQFISPEISLVLAKAAGSSQLTGREVEILGLIAEGRVNKEIADRLSIAENTVKNHVKSILAKLTARDRTHAISEELRRGLITLE